MKRKKSDESISVCNNMIQFIDPEGCSLKSANSTHHMQTEESEGRVLAATRKRDYCGAPRDGVFIGDVF